MAGHFNLEETVEAKIARAVPGLLRKPVHRIKYGRIKSRYKASAVFIIENTGCHNALKFTARSYFYKAHHNS